LAYLQYKLGETSIHGKMTLSRDEEGAQGVGIKCSKEVDVERKSHVRGIPFLPDPVN
jgi:hypothetical protein